MKKIILLTLVIVTTILSCSREEDNQLGSNESLLKLPKANISVLTKDGKHYISDDMLISEEQLQYLKNIDNDEHGKSVITSQLFKVWPNGEIPYTIAPGFSNPARISQAITNFTDNTGIKLIPRTSQIDYVEFTNSSVSNSYVGRQGGMQIINIALNAGYGTVIHEIGHALGLGHEHQRPDRNNYIWVDPSVANSVNYQILDSNHFKMVGNIDFGSIMMYGPGNEMIRLDGGMWFAQRSALSETDRKGIYHHYQPYNYDYYQDEVIEHNTTGSQDIYHVIKGVKVNFFRNKSLHVSDLSYNIRVAAYFTETTYDHPNGYQTVEYYNMHSLKGGKIYWESRTDTHLGYAQPGHHEKYLYKILVENQ